MAKYIKQGLTNLSRTQTAMELKEFPPGPFVGHHVHRTRERQGACKGFGGGGGGMKPR